MEKIGACYYPTKVLILDDSQRFVQAIGQELSRKCHTYEGFSEANTILERVNSEYKFDPFTSRYIKMIDEAEYQHRRIDIDLYTLHKEVYMKDRFEAISTVVIDYDMPEMNGLEVCGNINNSYINKILLTGVTDESFAVEAFNKGLIHSFVKKQDPNMLQKLNALILQAQERYFISLSETILKAIETDGERITAINDPVFIKLFDSLVKQYNIVEYYIIEAIGCFLMLDEGGRSYGLFLADEEIMDSMIIEAVDAQGRRNLDIARMLFNREKLLCYHNKFNLNVPYVDKWVNYLYKANKLVGEKAVYYWAFAPKMLDLDEEKIYSFNAYRNQ
jgi:CheY-like chemotaxis protein